ncbi:MAG TPA: hypothetical protein VKA43_16270 [Gammaproteobacteria bacterium]|nr:hypothetical protein [Gammaproteobacteria bacterium]
MPPKKSLQLLASAAGANTTRRTNSPIWRQLARLPLLDWYVARRESAYAERQCRLLLEIYEHFRSEHPELGSDELYARIVEHGLDCDSTAARSIVLEADRSFAQWPTERDVTFRDVVVFLLLNQLLPADSKTLGIQANVTAIVAKAIPLRL